MTTLKVISKPNFLFDTARKLALTSDYGRFRMGAIVASGKSIVSMGTNSKKTHPLQKKFTNKPWLTPWRHAEIHALSLTGNADIGGCDVYVCRVLADNSLGTSKPCSGCTQALKHFGIRGAYFYEDGKFLYHALNN
jgi:tRNA(Arg) A34 adenosine deaminase TadA